MTRILDNALGVTENRRASHPRSIPQALFAYVLINTNRIPRARAIARARAGCD
jgi:hypothetical protein